MYVTVTKHNYTPYEGYALVSGMSGPFIVVGSMILDDNGGDGQINPGEDIDLGIWAKNIGGGDAVGVYGLLLEFDPYVTMSAASSWYGTIPNSDSTLSHTDYEFSVASNCPDDYVIQFIHYFHDFNDSIWTEYLEFTVYAPPGVEEYDEPEIMPTTTMLSTVYPNPFSQNIKISYQVSKTSRLNLRVYDVSGRLVRTLKDDMSTPGYYHLMWDGKDDMGRKSSTGIYFVKFNTSDYDKIEKVILLK